MYPGADDIFRIVFSLTFSVSLSSNKNFQTEDGGLPGRLQRLYWTGPTRIAGSSIVVMVVVRTMVIVGTMNAVIMRRMFIIQDGEMGWVGYMNWVIVSITGKFL